MFIELTDHLRCTADHPEQFLVLLPDRMDGRRVDRGSLGCPVCGRVVPVVHGIADFGGGRRADRPTSLTAPAVTAFLGLSGPGGYLALLGSVAAVAPELVTLMPGVRLVLVNPPEGLVPTDDLSVVLADRLPVKSRSMRGVVIGADPGDDPAWVEAAIGAVLPGNPVIGEGPTPAHPELAQMAEAAGVWVGRTAPPGRR